MFIEVDTISQTSATMISILIFLASLDSSHILDNCTNNTRHIPIAHRSNIPGWFFERFVSPGKNFGFQTLPDVCLEIHSGEMVSVMVCDRIDCLRLQVNSLTSGGVAAK